MVRGLELFREHFAGYADRYILIGGTACDLIMSEAGLSFRATKDLDIVLCVEALDATFARAFWAFVKQGSYQVMEMASGKKQLYRFQRPKHGDYPFMLELFSRAPDALSVADASHLTPIPVSDEVSSLSAILLDDSYYAWIQGGKRQVNGLTVLGAEHLIPLKAKAWLELSARKAAGETIDSRDIRKHKNDIFRLFNLLSPQPLPSVPDVVTADLTRFVDAVATESVDLKSLGIASRSLPAVLADLRVIYLGHA